MVLTLTIEGVPDIKSTRIYKRLNANEQKLASCLPTFLHRLPSSCLPAQLPIFLPSCFANNLPAFLHSYPYSYLPAYLIIFLPSCIATHFAAFLHTYPIFLPSFIATHIPAFLHSNHFSCLPPNYQLLVIIPFFLPNYLYTYRFLHSYCVPAFLSSYLPS